MTSPEDDTTDAADAKRAPKREAAKLARQVDINDLRWLMGNRSGRRIVRRLMSEAGIYRDAFTGDAQTTAYQLGKRALALFFVNEVALHTPDEYVQMLTESKAQ